MEWTPEARKSNAYAWLTGERLHYSRGVDKQTETGLVACPEPSCLRLVISERAPAGSFFLPSWTFFCAVWLFVMCALQIQYCTQLPGVRR